MKKLWLLIFVLVIFFGVIFREPVLAKVNDIVYQSPCNTPLTYNIGKIDPRFNMSETQIKDLADQAAATWNQSYGSDIFVYDPKSPMTINMVYDDRQSLNTEINQKNQELEQKDNALKPEIAEYKSKVATLNAQIQKLNEEIEASNNRGGATPEEYERLKAEQNRLNQEATALNKEAESLSLETQSYNNQIAQLDQRVDTYNTALSAKPEGGVYISDEQGRRIEIYIFDSQRELLHTLTHELGHARGLNHVADPHSIMYAKTNESVSPTQNDIAELQLACQKQNMIVAGYTQFALMLHQALANIVGNPSS